MIKVGGHLFTHCKFLPWHVLEVLAMSRETLASVLHLKRCHLLLHLWLSRCVLSPLAEISRIRSEITRTKYISQTKIPNIFSMAISKYKHKIMNLASSYFPCALIMRDLNNRRNVSMIAG